MFIDASAFCAIFLAEPDGPVLDRKIAAARACWTSPVAAWETVRAMLRTEKVDIAAATRTFEAYLEASGIEIMAVGVAEQALAIEAFERFGKGRHPAGLNMGDCFAYACARSRNTGLLYKGEDFARTDIRPA